MERELTAHLPGREAIDDGEALASRSSHTSLLFTDMEVNTKTNEQKEVKVTCCCITSCPMTQLLKTTLAISPVLWVRESGSFPGRLWLKVSHDTVVPCHTDCMWQ